MGRLNSSHEKTSDRKKMEELKKKVDCPSREEIIQLILLEDRVSPDQRDQFLRLAGKMIRNYFPLEQKRLVKIAKKALQEKDEEGFRQILWNLEDLNDGAGKVAYDQGWILWKERPWGVHNEVKRLKNLFGDQPKICRWEKDDEYHKFMGWR